MALDGGKLRMKQVLYKQIILGIKRLQKKKA